MLVLISPGKADFYTNSSFVLAPHTPPSVALTYDPSSMNISFAGYKVVIDASGDLMVTNSSSTESCIIFTQANLVSQLCIDSNN